MLQIITAAARIAAAGVTATTRVTAVIVAIAVVFTAAVAAAITVVIAVMSPRTVTEELQFGLNTVNRIRSKISGTIDTRGALRSTFITTSKECITAVRAQHFHISTFIGVYVTIIVDVQNNRFRRRSIICVAQSGIGNRSCQDC